MFGARVCGGRVWLFGRLGEVRVAGPGAARDSGRVPATGSGVGRKGQERGSCGGMWRWGRVCCVGGCVRLQRRPWVVTCRPGGLEEKLAVFCGRGKDFADECAYMVHLLFSGGKRLFQCWAKVHAVEDPVVGLVSVGEGVLRPGGGVCPRVWACLDLCGGGGDGPDSGHGPRGRPAALDPLGQAGHGQSQVVARPPRGDLDQGASRGLVPRLEDAPEDFVRGGGCPYCPWLGGPWGEHGVGTFDEPFWADGCCCGGHYVVVPALKDCTPDLRRGVVAVCWPGGGGRRRGCKGRRRGGRCRDSMSWPVPTVRGGSGLLGGPSPLGIVIGVWSLDV